MSNKSEVRERDSSGERAEAMFYVVEGNMIPRMRRKCVG